MNIFYLDEDVDKCAEYHCDKHVVKQILEYSQLLSSAIRYSLGRKTLVWKTNSKMSRSSRVVYLMPSEIKNLKTNKYLNQGVFKRESDSKEPYMATHLNHPSTIWTRYSKETYSYMVELLKALCKEYTYRYNKVHKCESMVSLFERYASTIKFKNSGFIEPLQAMPDEYKNSKSSVDAYRAYYNGEKRKMLVWKNRDIPGWITL